jgi:hypothetical protein
VVSVAEAASQRLSVSASQRVGMAASQRLHVAVAWRGATEWAPELGLDMLDMAGNAERVDAR